MNESKITDLNDEILISIAQYLSPESIFALERTCKELRAFFSQPLRQIWISILSDLDDFHAPTLPPHTALEELSSKELKQLVYQALKGYYNWNNRSGPRTSITKAVDLRNKGLLGSLSSPSILGLISSWIHHNSNRGGSVFSNEEKEIIKFVEGGQYICLLWSEGYLQCWDARSNSACWTYPQLGTFKDTVVTAFDVEYVSNKCLNFVISETDTTNPNTCSLRFVQLDLSTRKVRWLHSKSLVRNNSQAFARLRFCGPAVIAVSVCSTIVSNRTFDRMFILKDVIGPCLGNITVVDGHLLISETDETGLKFTAIDIETIFDPRWGHKIPLTKLDIEYKLSSESELLAYTSSVAIPVRDTSFLDAAQMCAYRPIWRGDKSCDTVVYAAAMVGVTRPAHFEPNSLSVFKLRLKSRATRFRSTLLGKPPDTPLLLSEKAVFPLTISRPHPFSREVPYAITRTGQCLLSSYNTKNKGRSMFAVPLENLLEGTQSVENLKHVFFGRRVVIPGAVALDETGACLCYITEGEKRLVLQYYI